MAKSNPSYQYYPTDFDASTRFFTLEEVGAYQRLLNAQWENGFIPDDLRKLAMAIGTTPDRMDELWETLEEKFPVVSKGRRANPRMERIRSENKAFRKKQSEAGRAGAKARWKKERGASDDGDRNATANGDRIDDRNATANGDPNANPNGQNMALQSSVFRLQSSDSSKTAEPAGPASAESEPRKRKTLRTREQVYADPDFTAFWEAYPKKAAKGDAAKAWAQTDPEFANGEFIKRPADVDQVIGAVEERAKTHDWTKDGGQFVPNPATWLRAAGWEDKVQSGYGKPLPRERRFQPLDDRGTQYKPAIEVGEDD